MMTDEVRNEIDHIKKLFGTPQKGRYQHHGFSGKKANKNRIVDGFKRDMVDSNNKRFR